MWKRGETLPPGCSEQYPPAPQKLKKDSGINVLVDIAHECSFWAMWQMTGALRELGFRVSGCQATLDTVLVPGSVCRVRIPAGQDRPSRWWHSPPFKWVLGRWRKPRSYQPFAWWHAPRFNVVIVNKRGHTTPEIVAEEREALVKFVEDGGGLIVLGGSAPEGDAGAEWSANKLAACFGTSFTTRREDWNGKTLPVLTVTPEWEVLESGDTGEPVVIRRRFGKGRVVMTTSDTFDLDKRREQIAEQVQWAAAGSPPAGGEPRLPAEMWGGGAIYPEHEVRLEHIVIFYAKNAKQEVMDTLKRMPAGMKQLYDWLPSSEPEEPMYLIAAAGGGGGWAVNVYLPKEIGIISMEPRSFISIYGHEQAHTMSGPPGATGIVAADHALGGNQGEAHAGWFQGKLEAVMCIPEEERTANRGCNSVFVKDSDPPELDEKVMKKWRETGFSYAVIWYAWQKMDDRYGPTWYPRWRWVQYTRCADTPDKKLTLDETIEDMSIAVGEDLFPFFRKLQSNVTRERFEQAEFMGETLQLSVAPIELTLAGKVNVGPIGDYTKPLTPRE